MDIGDFGFVEVVGKRIDGVIDVVIVVVGVMGGMK